MTNPESAAASFPVRSPRSRSLTYSRKKHRKKSGRTKKASQKKLDTLRQTLIPIPFAPSKTLDFDAHQDLLKRLGLWDFVHIQFDRSFRTDLLAQLIGNFNPAGRCSHVSDVRVMVNRADLGRALKLPVPAKSKKSAVAAEEEMPPASEEEIAFLEELVSHWVLLHEDTWMMSSEVLNYTNAIKEGQFSKVDWAGLIWVMVNEELVKAPKLENCYYAAHLQYLMKCQKEDLFSVKQEDKVEIDLKEEDEEEEEEEDEEEDKAVEEEEEEEEQGGGNNEIEDGFFNVKELGKYLKETEAEEYKNDKEVKDEEEDDDKNDEEDDDDDEELMNLQDGDDGEEGKDARYEDFFGKKTLSTHEKEQLKLKTKIEQMEKANMDPKTWTMQGEVNAAKRPKNSALEVDLDFEHNVRPAPVITEEVTVAVEDMIRKRIEEELFDDVQRAPTLPTKAPRKSKDMDETKNKDGLHKVYEEEYLQQTNANSSPLSAKDKEKTEAELLFKKLCLKLDALSHFHFTPKPVIEEMSIQDSVPALVMEEIAPVAVSDAAMLAPEEVFSGKGDIKEEAELTQADRKRRRANKKRKFKARTAERMAKKPRDSNKDSIEAM